MKKLFSFFKKPYRWALTFSLILIILSSYVLLEVFVIPKKIASSTVIATNQLTETTTDTTETDTTTVLTEVTENSYTDEHISISIEQIRSNDTTLYVADIQLTNASYLKTAFADGSYGRNIKEATSTIAEKNQAIFAINGDFYGFRDAGYVVRNGEVYRDTPWKDSDTLIIDSEGTFTIENEGTTSLATILAAGDIQQVFSFGPALVEDGKVVVSENTEVGQAMTSNPRTAVGYVSEGHYIFIVADGRTDESEGLTLYQLANEFEKLGVTVAYNLDGGGSSTMWFNGEVINTPTSGRSTQERAVSDIIYIGNN